MPYKNKISGIYIILNKENGKFYIGSSVNINSRWALHKRQLEKKTHSNMYLQRAWDKYGKDSFIFEVVEECNKEECIDLENKWLQFHQTFNIENGYNIIKQANNTLGYKHTKENKQRMKNIATEKWSNMTEEEIISAKQRLSLYRKGKPISEEHKKALSEGLTKSGWLQSKRKKAITAKSNTERKSKPILQFDKQGNFIREFLNAREAVLFLGLNIKKAMQLNRVAKNNQDCFSRSVYNFKWKYKNDI